jgi:DNA-binding HxlR family transcriptional regulator
MKRLKKRYGCPVELSLEFVGGKWTTVILAWLKEEPHRYGELRRRIPGMADKVLSEKLQTLERLGLISKKPPEDSLAGHVYGLTPRGDSLRPVLDVLHSWGEAMAQELEVSVKPTQPL